MWLVPNLHFQTFSALLLSVLCLLSSKADWKEVSQFVGIPARKLPISAHTAAEWKYQYLWVDHVLEPLFFIVAANDLPCHVSQPVICYVDGTTIIMFHPDILALQKMSLKSLEAALKCYPANKLLCDQDKNHQLLLGLFNDFENKTVKLLGFSIDFKLSWGECNN